MSWIRLSNTTFFLLFFLPLGFGQFSIISPPHIDSLLEKLEQDTSISLYQHAKQGEKLIKWAEQANYPKGKYQAHLETGIAHLNLSQYKKALVNFQDCYSIAKSMDSLSYMAESSYFLGNVHNYLDNLNKSKIYLEESLGLYARLKNLRWMGIIKNSLGVFHTKNKNYDDALASYQESLSIFESNELERESAIPMSNIGDLYWRMKQPELALHYLEKALMLNEKFGSTKGKSITLSNIGLAYRDLKNYDLALQYFNQSLAIAETHQYRKVIYDNYKDLSDTYKEMGNKDIALDYFEQYHVLKDSILNQEKNAQISELLVAYETEKKEAELAESKKLIETLEQEQQITRLTNYLIVGSMISLIVFVILFYSRQRAKRQLIETELKNEQLERQQLKRELAYKEQDLTNFALDITRKNEFSTSVYESLKEIISANPANAKKKARELLLLTANHLKINDDIEQFQMNVDKVNQEFFDKLQAKFSNLTANEKQLCGLIRLNLSIKEIATIRNISPKSVEMSRYRLRKKLELEKGEDMTLFLQNF